MMELCYKSTDTGSNCRSNQISFTALILVILCIINCIVYFPTIGGYFLADDFVHISYVYDAFHGKPNLLLTNFYSNSIQAAGTKFYRPFLTLSLALDYLIWKNNALGYHLSNLFFQICSTVLLYFLTQRLAIALDKGKAKLVAAMTALLFAVYPLHPEVVSWVTCRVDSLATMFYLAACLLFFKYKQDRSAPSAPANVLVLILSLVCYLCGMFSKEIAVTLPIALWLWLVIFDDDDKPVWRKALLAFNSTLPYWLLLCAYLVLRFLALGTICGGYSGSLALNFAVFKSFTEQPFFNKLFLPFNDQLFSPRNLFRRCLSTLYSLAAVALVLRLLNKRVYYIPVKLMIYGILWFVICLLPTYQVLYLAADLQGSHFLYLASVPLCLLFSLMLVPILRSNGYAWVGKIATDGAPNTLYTKVLTLTSASVGLTVAAIFAFITYQNNIPWRRAGDELRQLQAALMTKAATILPGKKLVLVDMPHHYKGAHMLYNGATLDLMCSRAISGQNISPQIITFEHPLFGDPDLVNRTRLKRFLAQTGNYVLVAWKSNLLSKKNGRNDGWNTINVCLRRDNGRGELREIHASDAKTHSVNCVDLSLSASELVSVDPHGFDFLELHHKLIGTADNGLLEINVKASNIVNERAKANNGLYVQWFSADDNAVGKEGCLGQPLIIDGKTHAYLFDLGEHKSWLLCNSVDRLKIWATPGKYRLSINNVRFLDSSTIIPQFDLYRDTARFEDDSGVYHLTPKQVITFQYDATHIVGAQAVVYESSKSNVWFEHEDQTLNSNHFSHNAILVRKLPNLRGDFEIHGSDLGLDYFETHLTAVDKKGYVVGLMSDPVYAQVGAP